MRQHTIKFVGTKSNGAHQVSDAPLFAHYSDAHLMNIHENRVICSLSWLLRLWPMRRECNRLPTQNSPWIWRGRNWLWHWHYHMHACIFRWTEKALSHAFFSTFPFIFITHFLFRNHHRSYFNFFQMVCIESSVIFCTARKHEFILHKNTKHERISLGSDRFFLLYFDKAEKSKKATFAPVFLLCRQLAAAVCAWLERKSVQRRENERNSKMMLLKSNRVLA